MSKPTTSKEQLKSGTVEVPATSALAVGSVDSWDSSPGETFGGVTEILRLDVNQVSAPLVFSRVTGLNLKETVVEVVDGKPVEKEGTKVVSCPVAYVDGDAKKREYSLPIGAIFQKTFAEACCVPGDKFLIRRFPDAKKKGGRGAGQTMHVYGLKVIHRVPRETPSPVAPVAEVAQKAS